MNPKQMRGLLYASLLLVLLVLCSAFSYWGVGIQTVGAHSIRQNSVTGVRVMGGGPGSGK